MLTALALPALAELDAPAALAVPAALVVLDPPLPDLLELLHAAASTAGSRASQRPAVRVV